MRIRLPIALLLLAAPGSATVLCTTPDGRTYAGDKPPPGCVVRSEYANDPAPAAEPTAPALSLPSFPTPTKWRHEDYCSDVYMGPTTTDAYGGGRYVTLSGTVRNRSREEVRDIKVCGASDCSLVGTLAPDEIGDFHVSAHGGENLALHVECMRQERAKR